MSKIEKINLENKEMIESRIKEIISKQLNIDAKKINNNASFKDELGIDSFGAVELTFAIKEKLKVEIPQEMLVNIKTVQDIINYAFSKLKSD